MVLPPPDPDLPLPQLAHGSGVAVEPGTGKRTYMNMVAEGFGLDNKRDSVVFLFRDAKTYGGFVEDGWDADMAAETGQGFVNGIAIYQITASGRIARADVTGTKCNRDAELNESR